MANGPDFFSSVEDEDFPLKDWTLPFRQPLRGARITLSTPFQHLKGLIYILISLGAEVSGFSSNTSPIDDHAAATMAPDRSSFSCWKGETRREYWLHIERELLDCGPGGGPDLIVVDDGDATLLIHEGVKAEEIFAETGQLPDSSSTDNAVSQIILTIIKDGLMTDPKRYHKMKERLVGVSVKTTNGVERLLQMQANGTLLFPVINVTDSVTMNKFSNLYGCPSALFDGIKRATNTTISGKKAVVCGYDDAIEGCAIALKQAGAKVVAFVVDPNHAVQADLRGFDDIKNLDDVVSEADIFVTTGVNKGSNIVFNHIKKMKNNAIIYNVDPILDRNRNIYAGLEPYLSDMKPIIVNPQIDKWVLPDTNSSVFVLKNTGNPSSMLSSWSSTCLVFAILDLWGKRGSGKYENRVYVLSEHLEQKASALHLASKLMAARVETTEKETKGEADHVSAPMEEQGNVFTTRTEPKKIDKKRILLMAAQACSLVGIVALGLSTASKVKIEISLSAIWG